MHVYCLFCETQKCKTIASMVERTQGIRCIYPEIIQRKWVKGVPEEVRHSMLPGYLFLYSENRIDHSLYIPGIIRILGNGELQGGDLAFGTMLFEHNGVIGIIHLAETGQRCTVDDPLWNKMEGKVIKIDRGRKRCCVEFIFDNNLRTVWLGYEMIKPIQEDKTAENNSIN